MLLLSSFVSLALFDPPHHRFPLLRPSTLNSPPPTPPSVTVPTVLLFSPLCIMTDTLESPLLSANIQLCPLVPPTLAPVSFSLSQSVSLPSHLHPSSSRSAQVAASLPWDTRCYPRAIRCVLYIRLPMRRHIPYLRRVSACASAAIKVRNVAG